MKSTFSRKSWKRRWFRLSSDTITYSETPDSEKPLGVIKLSDVDGFECDAIQSERLFSVKTSSRDYLIQGGTCHDCYSWIRAITSALYAVDLTIAQKIDKFVSRKFASEESASHELRGQGLS